MNLVTAIMVEGAVGRFYLAMFTCLPPFVGAP